MIPTMKRPQIRISRTERKAWSSYEQYFSQNPLIQEYLTIHLKRWIDSVANPAELWLTQMALTNRLDDVERTLCEAVAIIGPDQLRALLKELPQHGTPEAISRKWQSIIAELYIAKRLSREYNAPIMKVGEHGDWQVGPLLVSVKSKEGLTSYWDSLARILFAHFITEDTSLITRAHSIEISGSKSIPPYEIGNRIIRFIRNELPEALQKAESLAFGDSLKLASNSIKGQVAIYSHQNGINVFANVPIDLQTQDSYPISLDLFDIDNETDYIAFHLPNQTFFQTENDIAWLRRFLEEKRETFIRDADSKQNFLGWIVIPTHASYLSNDSLIDEAAITSTIQEIFRNHTHPQIRISFVQEFTSGTSAPIEYSFPSINGNEHLSQNVLDSSV